MAIGHRKNGISEGLPNCLYYLVLTNRSIITIKVNRLYCKTFSVADHATEPIIFVEIFICQEIEYFVNVCHIDVFISTKFIVISFFTKKI